MLTDGRVRSGAGAQDMLLVLQALDARGEPSSGTTDMIERGRDVLGDANVFVVPLGDHPPVHVLAEAYGDALHLPYR